VLKRAVNVRLHALTSHKLGQFGGGSNAWPRIAALGIEPPEDFIL